MKTTKGALSGFGGIVVVLGYFNHVGGFENTNFESIFIILGVSKLFWSF